VTLTEFASVASAPGGVMLIILYIEIKRRAGNPQPTPDPTATALESVAAEMRNLRLELVQHRTEADTRLSEHDRRLGAIENRINSR
jgi:hypothetical protein